MNSRAVSVTVNGIPRTLLTVSVGSTTGASSLRTVSIASTMVWTPSAAVTDLAGRPASAAPVAETGALDREF